MDVELPNYRTGINRDVFVFCAFTSLSHADVVKLTYTDIHTDDNGERWIIGQTAKDGYAVPGQTASRRRNALRPL